MNDARERLESFARTSRLNFPIIDAIEGPDLWRQLSESYPTPGRQGNTIFLPYVVMLSSDGVMRWRGEVGIDAQNEQFRAALRTMLEIDPGVQARRDVEDRFLRGEIDEAEAAREAAEAAANAAIGVDMGEDEDGGGRP